jgi:hypothetical protein
MRRRARAALFVFLSLGVPAAIAESAGEAVASVTYTSPYSFEQTFGSALRLIRVDLGLKITEKDVDGGYLLFEYTSPESGKRVHQGSVEIVKGKETVHVAVQLPALPRYHEQMIIDSLAKKLAAEHGEPPKKAKPPAPAPAPSPAPDESKTEASKG